MTEYQNPIAQQQSRRVIAWSRVLIICIVCAMLLQLARVAQLKIRPEPQLLATVGSPTSSRVELVRRGDVLDRRGRIAATSTLGYRLFVDPAQVSDINTIAVELAQLIDMDPVKIDKAILPRRDRRYAPISDILEDWQVEAIRAARLRGVGLEPRLVRQYPHGSLAANVIGMVGFEHTGLGGLEHVHNDRLAPSNGRLTYLRDARRRALWIEPVDYRPGQAGQTLQLSIDLVIQELAETRLQQAVTDYGAAGGRVIVLDSQTGEILAMIDIGQAYWDNDRENDEPATTGDTDQTHTIAPTVNNQSPLQQALRRNRCVTDPYEPGSTFKPFIWAVATALGKADPEEILKTPGPGAIHRTSRGRPIRDAFPYADATWHETLVRSLNSGMAIVAERLTEREMRDAILQYGFGSLTRAGMPGETAGIVTDADKWTHFTQTSVPMGHEIAVTPLQMVRAFSVFARDGTLPQLRTTAVQSDEYHVEVVRRVLPEWVVLAARQAMRDVARRIQGTSYEMFGKSGTAQLPRPDGKGYYEDRYVSSFIAAAPFEDPRIVVLCVLDDPDKSKGHFGGRIAGPVVRDIIEETLTYLGVPPTARDQDPLSLPGGED